MQLSMYTGNRFHQLSPMAIRLRNNKLNLSPKVSILVIYDNNIVYSRQNLFNYYQVTTGPTNAYRGLFNQHPVLHSWNTICIWVINDNVIIYMSLPRECVVRLSNIPLLQLLTTTNYYYDYYDDDYYYYYGTTLNVCFIASQAAPANSSISDHSQHLARVAHNLLQAVTKLCQSVQPRSKYICRR